MGILYGIEINGCTYGSAGIETAYKIGAQNYLKDGNNQVILITDGDLNFGITSKGGLKSLIEEKKKSNLFLSVIGTGLYNYKDDNLEVLAKHGNGTYCVVNDLEDVEESINKRYIALTNIVAKDVKAQVEFNPRFVKNYRLLGYENRELNHEDFTNDAVISEPYGSGSHGVALYELEMAAENSTPTSDLKYQTPVLTDSDELGTVKIRYKDPLSDVSHPIEATFFNKDYSTSNARLAYLLYCISENLRGSDKLDEADEAYLADMLTDRKYKDIAGPNLEKLDLLIDALNPTSEWEYSDDFDLTF
jgi:Ca-activated chloride channel family protein